MKHLMLSLALLLPVFAQAEISLKVADQTRPNGNKIATITGEDAVELKALIGKGFAQNENRGIQKISCQNEECKILFSGEVFNRVPRDHQREDAELNTLDQTFTPNDNDLLVSIPSGAWYFHTRDEVVKSDKALYKYLDSLKNAEKGELNDSKTVSIEGKNFKLACVKNKHPKKYEMAKCLGPHGGCLPSIFSKYIKITHQCRSYLRADSEVK
jgi:hypothetical protein